MMNAELTPEFERRFQTLVQTWEQHEALKTSDDLAERARARLALDHARWDAAASRRRCTAA